MSKTQLMRQPRNWNDLLQIIMFAASFCLTTILYSIVVLPFELMYDEEQGIRTCVLGAWNNLLSACNGRHPRPKVNSPSPKLPKPKNYVMHIRTFLENQNLLKNKYEKECPLHELESIEIKPHSNGIEQQGKFRQQYQQQSVDGVTTNTISELYSAADEAMESFRSFLSRIAVDVIRPDSKSAVFVAYIKPRSRSLDKAQKDYSQRSPGPGDSWVYDVLRASIICSSVHEIIAIDNWLHVHAHIVQGKNRFKHPACTGYRDLIYHIRIQPNEKFHHICEIQVHLQPLWELSKRINSHGLYEKFRYYATDLAGSGSVQRKDLEAIARLGFLGESYARGVLKSGNVERLINIAALLADSLGEQDISLKLLELILARAEYVKVELQPHLESTICGKIGHLQHQKGNLDVAEDMHRRALALIQKSTDTDTAIHLRNGLGRVLTQKGMIREALAEFRAALNFWKGVNGSRQVDEATSWNCMGEALFAGRQLKSAGKAYQNALSIWLDALGEFHPNTALTYCNMGCVLQEQGDLDGAFQAFRKSARIRETVLGINHVDTAVSYSRLGLLLKDSAAHDESLQELEKALDIQSRVLGDNHPVTAATWNDIGQVLSLKGQMESALSSFQKALAVCESVQGDRPSSDAATYRRNVGSCLLDQGQYVSSLMEFQRALSVFEASLGHEHAETATCLSYIGTAKWKQGDLDGALEACSEAIQIRERLFGPVHASVASSCHDKGCVLWQQGNLKEALDALKRAREIRESLLGKLHQDTIDTNKTICSVLWQKGDMESIVTELKRQVESYCEVKDEHSHDQAVAALYKGMGVALNEMGDFEAALEAFQQALALRESALGKYHSLTADSHANIGVVLKRQGDLEASLKNFQQAFAIRLEVFGTNPGCERERESSSQQLCLRR